MVLDYFVRPMVCRIESLDSHNGSGRFLVKDMGFDHLQVHLQSLPHDQWTFREPPFELRWHGVRKSNKQRFQTQGFNYISPCRKGVSVDAALRRVMLHHILGPHAKYNRSTVIGFDSRGKCFRQPHLKAGGVYKIGIRFADQHGFDEIHGRRADEPSDESIGWMFIDLQGSAGLLQSAVVHDEDTVGHGHGLHLIVGDIDNGGPQTLGAVY